MIEVLHQVGLSKLLEQEGKGLNLWLGDGGRPLSGGEQRRLGLARIFSIMRQFYYWMNQQKA